ncbi:hypothetical protein ASPNIDRAFT_38196, partial [Aspergillus niger ATCC 1015]
KQGESNECIEIEGVKVKVSYLLTKETDVVVRSGRPRERAKERMGGSVGRGGRKEKEERSGGEGGRGGEERQEEEERGERERGRGSTWKKENEVEGRRGKAEVQQKAWWWRRRGDGDVWRAAGDDWLGGRRGRARTVQVGLVPNDPYRVLPGPSDRPALQSACGGVTTERCAPVKYGRPVN